MDRVEEIKTSQAETGVVPVFPQVGQSISLRNSFSSLPIFLAEKSTVSFRGAGHTHLPGAIVIESRRSSTCFKECAVLIAEDELTMRMRIDRCFQRAFGESITWVFVEDGFEAQKALARKNFRMVEIKTYKTHSVDNNYEFFCAVLDNNMPGKSGVEVAASLHRVGHDEIPRYFFSTDPIEECYQSLFTGWFAKMGEVNKLIAHIREEHFTIIEGK